MPSAQASSGSEGKGKSSNKRKDEDGKSEDKEDICIEKKQRVVWSIELHQHFVAAVNRLGVERAYPLKILKLMNVPGLSRENVASHLQKYRMYLKKLCGIPQSQSLANLAAQTSHETPFLSMSPPNGLDLLALATSGQLPTDSLAILHAAAFSKLATPSQATTPLVEKRNRPSKFGYGKPEASLRSFRQSPTTMEANQLGSFSLSQPFSEMNGSSQFNKNFSPLNQNIGCSQYARGESSNGLTLLSNAISSPWAPKCAERGTTSSHVPQGYSMANSTMNKSMELPGTGLPLTNKSRMSTGLSSKILSEINNWRNLNGYDFQKLSDWRTQKVGSTSHASKPTAFQGGSTSYASQPMTFQGGSGQQDFSSSTVGGEHQNVLADGGQNNTLSTMTPANPMLAGTSTRVTDTNVGSTSHASKPMEFQGGSTSHASQPMAFQDGSTSHASQPMAFQGVYGQQDFSSSTISGEHQNVLVDGGQNNTLSTMTPANPMLAGTSTTVTDPETSLFSESFSPDDLLNILLKQAEMQQAEDVIPNENNFGFGGYNSFDNLSS